MDEGLTEQMLSLVRAVGALNAQEYLAAGMVERARELSGAGQSDEAEACRGLARIANRAAIEMNRFTYGA